MNNVLAVSEEQLRRHLEALMGERSVMTPAALARAEAYVAVQLAQAGWSVRRQPLRWMGEAYHNVVATLGGATTQRLVLGAHFDTVEGTPGADDNASGIAVLLEAARLLAVNPPACTMECVAFTLEEMNMVGSAHYVRELKRSRVPVVGMWSLEMVGFTNDAPHSQELPPGLAGRYPSTGTFLAVVGNRQSQGFLRETMRGFHAIRGLHAEQLVVPMNGWWLPATRLSDHAPFWDAGYPALLVTDTAFLRNPHYHQPTDTLETLDLTFMRGACAGIVAAVQAVSASCAQSAAG